MTVLRSFDASADVRFEPPLEAAGHFAADVLCGETGADVDAVQSGQLSLIEADQAFQELRARSRR